MELSDIELIEIVCGLSDGMDIDCENCLHGSPKVCQNTPFIMDKIKDYLKNKGYKIND